MVSNYCPALRLRLRRAHPLPLYVRQGRAGQSQKAAIIFMALRLDGSSGCVRSMSTSAASLMICATPSAQASLLMSAGLLTQQLCREGNTACTVATPLQHVLHGR